MSNPIPETYVRLRLLAGHGVLVPKPGTDLVSYSDVNLSLHYIVQNVTASMELVTDNTKEKVQVIKVTVVLKNRYVFFLLNIYLPSLILLFIGYLSLFFPLRDFNERIMVTLTALLVETTFFTQVSDYAPRTSFLKTIDIWCIFCIVLLFSIIVAVTIINFYQ
ncbi:gamma-aminobutyric acid receptor subunit beta-like, partial [Hyalella azteca]|uniref:Gamma-aminobutyric acid receptor subunit beta-like n=1 Tax=Hyalella azteca TaxID=294128 RepID=A0A979FM67_HYAAZ